MPPKQETSRVDSPTEAKTMQRPFDATKLQKMVEAARGTPPSSSEIVCANPHCKTTPNACKTICKSCKTTFCSWDCRTYCFEREGHGIACKAQKQLVWSSTHTFRVALVQGGRTGLLNIFMPMIVLGKHRWFGFTEVRELVGRFLASEKVVGHVLLSAKFKNPKDRLGEVVLGGLVGIVARVEDGIAVVLMKEGIEIVRAQKKTDEDDSAYASLGVDPTQLQWGGWPTPRFTGSCDDGEVFIAKDGASKLVPYTEEDDESEDPLTSKDDRPRGNRTTGMTFDVMKELL